MNKRDRYSEDQLSPSSFTHVGDGGIPSDDVSNSIFKLGDPTVSSLLRPTHLTGPSSS